MKYSELYSKISLKLPCELSCEWDNDGDMLCLDGDRDIKKILVALDITSDVIGYAEENGHDMIVSHHPLIFKPMRSLNTGSITGKRVCRLIKSDIFAMSFHTRLDAVAVNDALAQALELENVEGFCLDGIMMGRIGVLPRQMSVEDFAEYVKIKLNAPFVEYPKVEKSINRVALLGGSGAGAAELARSLGADCLLTGECGYNKALDSAESGFPIIVAGHYYTENPVCDKIVKIINDVCEEVVCEIYPSNIFGVK